MMLKRNQIVGLKTDEFFIRAGRIWKKHGDKYIVIYGSGESFEASEDELEPMDYKGRYLRTLDLYPDWFKNKMYDIFDPEEYYAKLEKYELAYKDEYESWQFHHTFIPMPKLRTLIQRKKKRDKYYQNFFES